jgi:hypothetical protein
MRRHLTFLFFLALTTLGRATSVIPPSFPELVNEADAIYRGRVTDIQARRTTAPDGTVIIKTHVTLVIERTLKGEQRSEITLDFLGGTIGDESLVVTGMPKFNLGASEYVFVQRNGRQFCPLVAMGHGRYRLARDPAAARDYIARDNGTPITDPAEIELPLIALPTPVRAASAASAITRALSPEAFETSISAEVQRPTLPARQN